uniref:Cas scaffold protein family member 4 n=1 Tax=Pipistrellus kuhlii TaxID=59472 RepID=A0A7J7Y8F1_PIPKU|nr:Cas scaffold protein family member 4 [Pipistrellus kuhlii]
MRGASGMDGAPKALLARALYNNAPDCFDELAFCKGDILTILEQHVPESEGWWRCLLHGRQGLAPANRLQILSEAPEDGPCPPLLTPLEKGLTSSKEAYQATTPLRPPPPGPVYESMKSWVVGPPPQTAQVYEFPDPPASTSARIVCEKVPSFPKQAVVPVPRPAQASLLALYDVPAQSRSPSALKEPGKQQLYDIPASPRKADRGPPAGRPSDPSAPGPLPPGQQDPGEKARLSEHCRLYFGALFKAVGVFRDSLLHAQPPETLVAQSKLVITIGQKLVDTLCRETQDRDARNEILRGSSRLCGLLKALALATKRAVLPRPGPAALQGLRAAAQELEQHARQFRGSLD